ncbi:MAG: hypothetical protein A4E63_01862 [Syntrophorhabdus sp. PtaU1.Bin050]|nr:MAG: hypothetical protein A4E63_01862 [Syntrophorhabdus sp. PtaU1.Bin050]
MKKLLVFFLWLIPCISLAFPDDVLARGGSRGGGYRSGSVRVKGHTTKSGKYVAPHYRSSPNKSKRDNWSTKGNVNPYTGKRGTKSLY